MTTQGGADIFREIASKLRAGAVPAEEVPAVRISSALVLYREGLASEAELLNYLAELGSDPLQRDRLLFSAQLDRRREIAEAFRAALVPLLGKGEIGQKELRAALVRVGYTADMAQLVVTLAAFRAGIAPEGPTPLPPGLVPRAVAP